jgi:hypothetical protein
MLSGSVHFHDSHPVNVHVHEGDKGAGHVHDPAHLEHDESDEAGKGPLCSIGHPRSLTPSLAPSSMPPNNGVPSDRTARSVTGLKPRAQKEPKPPQIELIPDLRRVRNVRPKN